MPIPITVPRLGWNMEQGVFAGWLKADGATVQAGEALFTLEGDKATEDVECLDSGILHVPANAPREGDTVPVGAVIGYLLQPGEPAPAGDVSSAPLPQEALTQAAANVATTAPISTRDRPASSPRARRTAARLGLDWMKAAGTGRSGRVRERDVLALAAAAPASPAVSRRRAIAERLTAAHRAVVPVTLMRTVDATELVRFRGRCQAASDGDGIVPSYTDLFVKLAATALEKHPGLNARWGPDGVEVSEHIHVGIAVDCEAGLLVPVLRDVPRLTLREVSARSRDLIERARQGKLSASELAGGTFTVTSLGGLDIDAFTPVINYPECAILGVGRIRRCPAVIGDEIAIREQVTLSLTFDHRVCDGAPAARFLQTLAALIEQAAGPGEPR